jgi:hypothetical protein
MFGMMERKIVIVGDIVESELVVRGKLRPWGVLPLRGKAVYSF